MKKYSKLFAFIFALAIVLPGVAQAILVDTTDNGIEVHRLGGTSRVGTAVLASKTAYPNGSDSVVLAGFNGEVDALTGTILAADKKAPLLITRQEELTKEAEDEIARLKAKTVYILGGEAVVSKAVETKLTGLGKTVVRVSGANRDETAGKVAQMVKGTNVDHVFLALGRPGTPGDALADALAIGPVSAMKNMPVLLTEKNNIPPATKQAMKDLKVKKVTIVGLTSAVSKEVETMLRKDYAVDRVGGDNRENTALNIAGKYFKNPDNLIVAYGRKSADALVGGYLGAKMNAPILLTDKSGINASTTAYIAANAKTTYVLGGEAVITKAVLQEIVRALETKKATVEEVNALIEALPEEKILNVSNWESYAQQIGTTRDAYETLTADQKAKLKPENQTKYDKVMKKAEALEAEYLAGLK